MTRELREIVNESYRFMRKHEDGIGWEGAQRLVREAFEAGRASGERELRERVEALAKEWARKATVRERDNLGPREAGRAEAERWCERDLRAALAGDSHGEVTPAGAICACGKVALPAPVSIGVEAAGTKHTVAECFSVDKRGFRLTRPAGSPGTATPRRRGQEVPHCSRCGAPNLDLDVGAGRWFCHACLGTTGNGATSVEWRSPGTGSDDEGGRDE